MTVTDIDSFAVNDTNGAWTQIPLGSNTFYFSQRSNFVLEISEQADA